MAKMVTQSMTFAKKVLKHSGLGILAYYNSSTLTQAQVEMIFANRIKPVCFTSDGTLCA